MPVLILTAVGGVLFFWLSRRLMGDGVALLAALFALLDPFWLAHSKIIHLDALLTLAVTLTWLFLLVATRTHVRSFYVAGGIAGGLGALTKSPSLALAPLIISWLLFDRLSEAKYSTTQPSEGRWVLALRRALGDCLWVGLPAALTCFLLWPALWVAPLQSIGRVLGLMQTYSQTGHELGNFWLGQAVAAPGGLFYGAVLLWRTSPLTLIGGAMALALTSILVWRRRSDAGASVGSSQASWDQRTLLGLWAFVVWYTVIFSLGDKKFDRYLLPIFLVFDLLAAFGWVALAAFLQRDRASSTMATRRLPRLWITAITALLIVQGWLLYANAPSYLTAYNPLLGGMRTARQVMLVGWGEGLEQAAAFINGQTESAATRVSSWYGCNVFAPFLVGAVKDICYESPTPEELYRGDVDFVVTYVNQIQRDLLDPGVAARLRDPLFVVRHGDVDQASVYAWPKPYAHTGDRTLSEGWRLMGWEVAPHDPTHGRIDLTLFWDQAALSAHTEPGRPVTAWLKDGAGEVWAETESALTGAERITPGWSGAAVVEQKLTLVAPPGLAPGPYRLEVAPFAGDSASVGEIQVQPLRLSVAASDPDLLDTLNLTSLDIRFGDELALTGYQTRLADHETVIDLIWSVTQTPQVAYKTFVHLVGPSDEILAQQDVCLGSPSPDGACAPMTSWTAGDVIRQRIRLLAGTEGKLYVGLYRPETGARLSLTAQGVNPPDGRFPLPAAATKGAR
jgi:4-amino-4-deoxy-L-arabinose transferase-like glycosyltransferase